MVLTGGGFKYNTGEGVTPISGSVSDGRIYVLDISFQFSNSREHQKYLSLSGGGGGGGKLTIERGGGGLNLQSYRKQMKIEVTTRED